MIMCDGATLGMRARGIGAILHLLALLFLGIELFLYLVGGLASLVFSAGSGGRSQQLQVQGFDDVQVLSLAVPQLIMSGAKPRHQNRL